MVRKLLGAATMTAGLALASPDAAASLIGDEVSVSSATSAFYFSSTTATVAEGPIEFFLGFNAYPQTMPINVEANSISFLSGGGFVFGPGISVTVSDLDFAGAPGGITGISVTGVDPSRISYTAHSVTFNFGGVRTDLINATVPFDTTVSSAIPAPSSLLVFSGGLVGLLGLRRTRLGRVRPGYGPLVPA